MPVISYCRLEYYDFYLLGVKVFHGHMISNGPFIDVVIYNDELLSS